MSYSVGEALSNIPIGSIGLNKPIETNRTKPQTNIIVDKLLADYSELIDPKYKSWFAKRFYTIPFDQLHRAASEARADGKESKRLFCHKIKELYLTN